MFNGPSRPFAQVRRGTLHPTKVGLRRACDSRWTLERKTHSPWPKTGTQSAITATIDLSRKPWIVNAVDTLESRADTYAWAVWSNEPILAAAMPSSPIAVRRGRVQPPELGPSCRLRGVPAMSSSAFL
jgi:hypothetical protein